MTRPLLPGSRYHLGPALGVGGMATVYRARDEVLGVERAVKVLRPELVANARLRERFEAEARTMARVRHPNVVSVYDFVVEGNRAALVMDFVEGGCLARLMEDQGPLQPTAALAVCHEIACGLSAVHESGIIHRDLKPQNVLVELDGTPRLTDFGIARDAELAHKLTRTGTVLGTLAYMPPEQREATSELDHRADIYALGATLFTLVSGRAPYDLYAQEFYDRLFDGVPHIIRSVVTRACAFSPSDRFSTAGEFATELQTLLVSEERSISDILPRPHPRSLAPLTSPSRETFYDDMSRGSADFDSSLGDLHTLGDDDDIEAPPAPEVDAGEVPLSSPPSRRLPMVLGIAGAGIVFVGGMWAAWPAMTSPGRGTPGPGVASQAVLGEPAGTTVPSSPPRLVPGRAKAPEEEPVPETNQGAVSAPAALTPASAGASTSGTAPVDKPAAPSRSAGPGGGTGTQSTDADLAPLADGAESRRPSPSPSDARLDATPAAQSPSPPPPAAEGEVFINSVPWSHVTVDGVEVGRTPWRGALPVGSRRVTLQPATGPSHSAPVTVSTTRESNYCWSFLDNRPCPK